MKKKITASLALTFTLALSACHVGTEVDSYATVVDACKYTVSGGTKKRVTDAEKQSSSLTPECRQALEPLIPYDSSMLSAPQWKRDQVTEAFQFLIGYPIKLPSDGRILGVAPHSIPLSIFCIFEPEAHPKDCPKMWFDGAEYSDVNKNLFNYVIHQFDTVSDGGDQQPSNAARFDLVKLNDRRLKIFNAFWSSAVPFTRSATLTHEAFHGEGVTHTYCKDGTPNCDADLSGAYAMSIAFNGALLQGAGSVKGSDGQPILSDLDILYLGFVSCALIRGTEEVGSGNLLNYPKELHTLLDPLDCNTLGVDWYIQQAGLTR